MQDLTLKLELATKALEAIKRVNKTYPNVATYEKVKFCTETATVALESVKRLHTHKIGEFVNIPAKCPYCGQTVTFDTGSSVDYGCGSTASRLNGVFYKRCLM